MARSHIGEGMLLSSGLTISPTNAGSTATIDTPNNLIIQTDNSGSNIIFSPNTASALKIGTAGVTALGVTGGTLVVSAFALTNLSANNISSTTLNITSTANFSSDITVSGQYLGFGGMTLSQTGQMNLVISADFGVNNDALVRLRSPNSSYLLGTNETNQAGNTFHLYDLTNTQTKIDVNSTGGVGINTSGNAFVGGLGFVVSANSGLQGTLAVTGATTLSGGMKWAGSTAANGAVSAGVWVPTTSTGTARWLVITASDGIVGYIPMWL